MIKFSGYLSAMGYKVNLKDIETGAQQLTAMTAGQVDVGTLGIPPVLIASTQGLPVGIISGVSTGNLVLSTWEPDIHSISDLTPSDKIAAASGTGGLPGIMLAIGAQKQFGNAQKFNTQLVNVAHAEGLQDLISHQVVAQIAPLPYYAIADKTSGIHAIGNATTWFGGPFNVDVLAGSKSYFSAHPQALADVKKALAESAAWIGANRAQAAQLLHQQYFSSYSVQEIETFLSDVQFTTGVYGTQELGEFMAKSGLLPHQPNYQSLNISS
jgi:NitT/TauT family transport system substrate-binding protein